MTTQQALDTINGAEIMSLNVPIRKLQVAVLALMRAAKRCILYDKQVDSGELVKPVTSEWQYRMAAGAATCKRCGFERLLDDNFGAAVACPNCGASMVKPADRECANCGRFREGNGCGAFVDNCMTDYDAYSNWIPKGGY